MLSKIIVIVDGIFGTSNSLLEEAAEFFLASGYDVKIMSSSSGCDLSPIKPANIRPTVIANRISAFLRSLTHYNHRFLVAYSSGAIFALLSDLSYITSLVLWEPSRSLREISSDAIFIHYLNAYSLPSDPPDSQLLLSPTFVEEARNLPQIQSMMRSLKMPTKVITAALGGQAIGSHVYFKQAPHPKAYCCIEGAHHSFDDPTHRKCLLYETLEWFERH